MNSDDEHLVWIDMSNPPPGRIDRSRMGKGNVNATDPYPLITEEDREATRRLAKQENWPRMKDRVKPVLQPGE
jgi:hypothetical protein